MKRPLLSLALALGLAGSTAQAQTEHIYLGNDNHTGCMWTTDADTCNVTFAEMLDYYLQLADEAVGSPSPYQSHCNADGSHSRWSYERLKSSAEFERLVARVKDRHIRW